ncbi:MAG: hypothetical protein AAF393_06155 [Pseudomonadota bacterium]
MTLKFLAASALAAGLTLGSTAQAQVDCDYLGNIIDDLDYMADVLESSRTVSASLDRRLRNMVLDARDVAVAENDNRAIKAANGMIRAWQNEDDDLYLRSSDRLADRLEFFWNRDC